MTDKLIVGSAVLSLALYVVGLSLPIVAGLLQLWFEMRAERRRWKKPQRGRV